jgi:predicted RNA binding protein YcfA (HicA-like mRNA interferase family)
MGGKLPAISGKRVVQALERAGFVVERIVGSHHVMVYPGNASRTVTVPVHANRDLKPGAALHHSPGRLHRRRVRRSAMTQKPPSIPTDLPNPQ